MIITKKRVIPDIRIFLNNKALQSCDTYKYLGVFFDSKLDWKTHINYIDLNFFYFLALIAASPHKYAFGIEDGFVVGKGCSKRFLIP